MSLRIVEFQTRPIEQWPGEFTKSRKRSQFSAGWGDTIALLSDELRHLNAKGIVLLMALEPSEIRLDGRPYANAKPRHPGVILSFTSAQGTMQFPCDRFTDWADNVRAIALALEALRKVDRYGVTRRGEQYRGWQALPDKTANGHMTRDEARGFLNLLLHGHAYFETAEQIERTLREAERKTHPDIAGGNADQFKRVQQARKVLIG